MFLILAPVAAIFIVTIYLHFLSLYSIKYPRWGADARWASLSTDRTGRWDCRTHRPRSLNPMHIPILLRGLSVRKRTRTSTGLPTAFLVQLLYLFGYTHIVPVERWKVSGGHLVWTDRSEAETSNSQAEATVSKTAVYSIPPHRHINKKDATLLQHLHSLPTKIPPMHLNISGYLSFILHFPLISQCITNIPSSDSDSRLRSEYSLCRYKFLNVFIAFLPFQYLWLDYTTKR